MPDAPVSLLRDETNTFSGQIGITWSNGAYNGGLPITAYRVSFDQGTNTYIVIASTVTQKSYIKTGLVPGSTYKFKV